MCSNFSSFSSISLIVILFFFSSTVAFSQSAKISGVVKDDQGITLPGVSILEKGTTNETVTNIDGEYTITVADPKLSVLQFSFIGFELQEVSVGGRSNIKVDLLPTSKTLQEAVIVGYGTTTKKEVTGATARVSEKELKN